MSRQVPTVTTNALLHIVICGSMSALKEMEILAERLSNDGYRVTTPVPEETTLIWEKLSIEEAARLKRGFLNDYFDIIRQSDAVLIANLEKHGIPGYIGANTLMEVACGHALGKPVFFLNAIGEQPCRVEAHAVAAGILDGDAGRLADLLVRRT